MLLLFVLYFGFVIKASGQINDADFNLMIANTKHLEISKVDNWNSLYSNVRVYIERIDTVTQGKIGSWSIGSDSIPYSSRIQTHWMPIQHLNRIHEITLAYVYENSPYYQSDVLFDKISKATQFWHDRNPTSTNWWFQEIAVPQKMGMNLLLLRSGLSYITSELESKLLERMKTYSSRMTTMTGANKVDIALHVFYRGILQKNQIIMTDALNAAKSTIFKNPGISEGIQRDFSYLQHGQQFYTTGYGEASLVSLINFLFLVKDSQYGLTEQENSQFYKFAREHYFALFRGKYYMYNGFGRAIANKGRLTSTSALRSAKILQMLDSEYEEVYSPIISRLSGTESASYEMPEVLRHYWVGDYTIYSSPSYNFDIRMSTTRTARVENGNDTNLKGYYLSEGAHSVLVDGDEYLDVFPVWDWSMIPGTTLAHKSTIPNPGQWEKPGNSIFGGGLTNGKAGITVYQMRNFDFNTNTTAQKSWFMFGDEIVCLGAGINSFASENVNTTVNQCVLSNDLVLNENGVERTPESGQWTWNDAALKWIYHGKTGYIFPQSASLNLSNQSQSGNWKTITSFYPDELMSKDVFKLWFNHGVRPQNKSYSYIIVPGKTLDDIRNYDASDIQVLMNSDSLQVVSSKSKNLMGFVFYKAASFTNSNFMLKTSGSCLILLANPYSDDVQGWISDPTQRKDELQIQFKSEAFVQEKVLMIKLPGDEFRGSTKAYSINQDTPDFRAENYELHKLFPIDETYIRNGVSNSNNNYGSLGYLELKNDNEGWRRDVLFNFDLAQIDTTKLLNSNLVLSVRDAGATVLSTNWSLYPLISNNWTESSVSWSNKPTYETNAISTQAGTIAGNVLRFDGLNNVIKNKIRSGDDKSMIS